MGSVAGLVVKPTKRGRSEQASRVEGNRGGARRHRRARRRQRHGLRGRRQAGRRPGRARRRAAHREHHHRQHPGQERHPVHRRWHGRFRNHRRPRLPAWRERHVRWPRPYRTAVRLRRHHRWHRPVHHVLARQRHPGQGQADRHPGDRLRGLRLRMGHRYQDLQQRAGRGCLRHPADEPDRVGQGRRQGHRQCDHLRNPGRHPGSPDVAFHAALLLWTAGQDRRLQQQRRRPVRGRPAQGERRHRLDLRADARHPRRRDDRRRRQVSAPDRAGRRVQGHDRVGSGEGHGLRDRGEGRGRAQRAAV